MKKILMLLFLTVFISCNEKIEIGENDLNQTAWIGSLIYYEGETANNCEISVYFYSNGGGEYYIKELNNNLYETNSTFNFSIDSKIILINLGYKNIIVGDWWISDYSTDKLILKRKEDYQKTSVLTLKRQKI